MLDLSQVSIGDIGLRWRLYHRLKEMNINVVADLKNLPPAVMEEDWAEADGKPTQKIGTILLEAIERVRRDALQDNGQA